MGGVGLAIPDSISIYFLNPASMAQVNLTRFQGDFLYERSSVDLQGGSGLFHDANVNSFRLAFPIKRGYVAAFGVQPYSRSEYEFYKSGSDSSKLYVENLNGSGGVSEFYLALAATLGPMRAGLTADFYFGSINRVWRVNFISDDLRNTEDKTHHQFSGVGLHFGQQAQLGKWKFGAAVGLPTSLTVKTELSTAAGFVSERSQSKLELPLWWAMGFGFAPNRHWVFGADWRTQRWSLVNPAAFFGTKGVDSYDLGLGFEVTPSFDALDGVVKRLSYRFGGAYRQLPYEEQTGNKIREWTASFGLGLPFGRGFNRIDLAVEAGKRGNLSTNVALENVLLVRASITGSERWFQRGSRR
jgi:hypothetical protein